MKKIIYTLVFLSLFATSCTSDDSNNDPIITEPTELPIVIENPDPTEVPIVTENPVPVNTEGSNSILPVRLDIIEFDGEEETITFTYDDNMRLIGEQSDAGYSLNYTYVNDRLTESTFVSIGSESQLETYTYDTQGRINMVTNNLGSDFSINYSNDNNTVTYTNTNAEPDEVPDTLSYNNGNLLMSFSEGDFSSVFTYGDNNGPFKNISNREILVRLSTENINIINFNSNNVLTEVSDEISVSEIDTINYSYTFTEENFPKVVTINEDGDVSTYTYTYNND